MNTCMCNFLVPSIFFFFPPHLIVRRKNCKRTKKKEWSGVEVKEESLTYDS